MQNLNTRVLIIIAGIILVLLIAVTIFVNGLTNKSQISQQPTLIPTGVFESSSSLNKGSSNENLLPSEGNENTDNTKLLPEDEANRLDELKNKTPLDSTDFSAGYSPNLGEFFVSTKTPQGEQKFKQYLVDNGLSAVFTNFPELFHISSQPLDQFIKQTEDAVQKEKEASDLKIQQKSSSKTPPSNTSPSNPDLPSLSFSQLSNLMGSLFTLGQGGDVNQAVDKSNQELGQQTTPGQGNGQGGGGGGNIGGPISATAQELLNNPKLTLSTNARMDLKNGIVDERLINLLATILQTHTLSVGTFKTGHSKYIADGCNCHISNHYYGRATDIGSIDGKAATTANNGLFDIVKWTTTLDCPQRPGEVESQFAQFAYLSGWFVGNTMTVPHLHLGYYQGCPNPKP